MSMCCRDSGVSYNNTIQPILAQHCAECHTAGADGVVQSGFDVGSHESVMKGTKFGPVIVAGDAASSSLYRLVAGKVDKSIQMPHGQQQLSAEQIAAIEKWIDQGAKNN